MGREEEIIKERVRKVKQLKEQGVNPYAYGFDKKHSVEDCLKAKLGTKVKTAGRVMNKRDIGKIIFSELQDHSGKIQIVFQDKDSGKGFSFAKKYIDTGDIVGIEGRVFKTKTKQRSVQVKRVEMLTKAILPLPAKWQGLQDKEERYRKRYLDLIMNPNVKEVFLKREKIIDVIRDFLKKEKFIEVETPALQTLYGGAEARPFITELWALKMKLYLSISPEIYLKKLLVGGMERVFTICKNFRNEGVDKWHNPEFTMMESYTAYWDYNDVRDMTERLLERLAKEITGKTTVEYQGNKINFKGPHKTMRLFDAIKKHAGFDPCNEKTLERHAKKLGFKGSGRDQMIHFVFDEVVQPKLIQPTFIIDYPKSICPLTKDHRKKKGEVERFELFVNGVELANAYSELNDPLEQEERLKKQLKGEGRLEKFESHFEANKLDEDFINAMKVGMPPAGGIGIGIDRLTLFLTNQPSIRDVIPFPFMKPEK